MGNLFAKATLIITHISLYKKYPYVSLFVIAWNLMSVLNLLGQLIWMSHNPQRLMVPSICLDFKIESYSTWAKSNRKLDDFLICCS